MFVSTFSMRAAFSSIVVLMVASAILQLSLVVDFSKPPPAEKEVKVTSLLTGVVTPVKKNTVWDSTPDLKRASFLDGCPDNDESSLSSVDENASPVCIRRKLKGE